MEGEVGHETEEQVLGRDPDKSKNNLEVSLQSHLSTEGQPTVLDQCSGESTPVFSSNGLHHITEQFLPAQVETKMV